MAGSAKRTKPKLWNKVKEEVTHGDKGGNPDQWSARKAQLAVARYKQRGGGYKGHKTSDNHLVQWTEEDWGTRSGKPSGETHERYLPQQARRTLTDAEYRRTTVKKQADTGKGKQFSRQPKDVSDKVAQTKRTATKVTTTRGPLRAIEGQTKAALMREARTQNIPGRSRMTKAELAQAVNV